MSTGDASERDLIDALVDYLEKGGQLGKFRAELFASVMSAMNNFSQNLPEIPKETRVINDLIREYLHWNGYQCTERTMVLETGQGNDRQSRENIASTLGIDREDCSGDLPLLYYVVAAFQNKDKVDD